MILNRVTAWRIALASALVLSFFTVVVVTFGLSPATEQTQRECPVRVTLLQVNDVYQFSPVDGGTRGGLARVLTLRRQIMKESPHALYLLAGDTIAPSVRPNTHQGPQ